MIWLWHDKPDVEQMAHHATATFWFVLPSLPMFLVIPALMRRGTEFWFALVVGCLITILLYVSMTWAASRLGFKL